MGGEGGKLLVHGSELRTGFPSHAPRKLRTTSKTSVNGWGGADYRFGAPNA